jgi:hypothetical protein
MVREFSQSELQLLLKFVTGSRRIAPYGSSMMRLNFHGENIDNQYPVGHTCGKSCDVPSYSTAEIMKERFKIAISLCGEIDDDGHIN